MGFLCQESKDKLHDRDFLIQKYINEKLTIKQISEIIGCSKNSVSIYFKKYNIPVRKISESSLLISKASKILTKDFLYQKYVIEKLSCKQICKITGIVSTTCILDYLRKYNIQTRISTNDISKQKDIDIKKIDLEREYIQNQKSISELCEYFCCCDDIIERKLKEFHIQKRSRQENVDIRLNVNEKLTYELLYDLYVNKKMTLGKISETTNFCEEVIKRKLSQYNIPLRTYSESAYERSIWSKIITYDFLYQKYIIENKTLIQIANELKCDYTLIVDYKNKYKIKKNRDNINKTRKNTLLKNYKNCVVFPSNSGVLYSKMSTKLFDKILLNIPLFFHENVKYSTNKGESVLFNKQTCSFMYLDFSIQIDNIKLCIEFNGDYWHGNPQIYTGEQFFKDRGKVCYYKDIWERDKQKLEYLNSIGYKTLVVWEKDFVENEENVVQQCLKFINDNINFVELGNKLQIDKDLYNELEDLTV